jgi:hypothetical protein
MHLHEEVPPLNPWPFLIGDAALIATACLISSQTHAPLTGLPLIAIAGCVALGAVLAVIPFLINQTRRQEQALAERQREIAALAQITATSAEQISIAVAGLHNIAESTARSLKLGEQLPHKIQEKINDFKTQLNEIAVTENEALAQEINTLRSNETERLETALGGVRKTAADLAMIETVNRKHLSDLNESLSRFISSAEKAASEAAKTIEAAGVAAEKSLAAAFARLDQKIVTIPEPTTAVAPPSAHEVEKKHTIQSLPQPIVAEPHPTASHALLPVEKKPGSNPATASASPQPFVTALIEDAPKTPPVEEKIARKRPTRKPSVVEDELMLGIEMPSNDFSQVAPTESAPALSADGLTRLLVTAYIGIGNKLFVRGEGPGLTWDHGVPLQFVSIGKWRWESADATAPVTLKLYKNDEYECAAIGCVTLAPGQQQQVTASFN